MSASHTSRGGGVDLPTLLTTAIASAAAAYVTSQLWAAGTLAAAAFTPVLVALLKEMLIKPAEVVTRAVPVRGVVRSATPGDDPVVMRGGSGEPPELVSERVAQQGELLGRSRPVRSRTWQAAILTGLLGFLVAAVIITVPEIVAGSSAAGGGRDTTFFGGHGSSSKATTTTPTTTTTTPTVTETTPLDETVTIAPPATVTVPPAETTPVPPAETPTVPDATAPDGTVVPPPAEPPPG